MHSDNIWGLKTFGPIVQIVQEAISYKNNRIE